MASTWVNVREGLKNILPSIAGAVTGPAGPVVQSLVADALGVGNHPDEVSQALQKDPDAAVKLKAIEAQILAEHDDATARMVEAVQKGIQADATGQGGWLQNNWHGLASLWAIGLVTGVYFVLSVWHGYNPQIIIPTVDPMAWTMIGAILGVTAWNDKRNS